MTQRSLLPAVGLTLGGVLLWILLRPSQAPDAVQPLSAQELAAPAPEPPAAASLANPEALADPAAPDAPPTLERLTLPSEEDQHRVYVASLPSASLRVHILDPYGVLSAPCSIRVETRLPNSQRARAERTVDRAGESYFDKLPAGKSWISLLCQQPGGEAVPLVEQALELAANDDREHLMDLTETIAVVDLEWACPPLMPLTQIDLRLHTARLASWQGESLFSGALRFWAPKPGPVSAILNLTKVHYAVSHVFIEPGRQVWRIEPPTGSLHLKWLGEPADVEFMLNADPSQSSHLGSTRASVSGAFPGASVSEADGQHSFYCLRPGRYHLQNKKEGKRGLTGQLVEIGTMPVHLTLEPRPSGTLNFIWPDLPSWAEPGQTNTRLLASLQARGAFWPVFASKSFSHLDEWRFDDVPEGDYDLVLEQARWTSRTPVTVLASGGEPVQLKAWHRQVNLSLGLKAERAEPEPPSVQLLAADGAVRHLESFVLRFGKEESGWSYRTESPSGSARLMVTRADGRTATFDFIVAEAESDEQLFRLPE